MYPQGFQKVWPTSGFWVAPTRYEQRIKVLWRAGPGERTSGAKLDRFTLLIVC